MKNGTVIHQGQFTGFGGKTVTITIKKQGYELISLIEGNELTCGYTGSRWSVSSIVQASGELEWEFSSSSVHLDTNNVGTYVVVDPNPFAWPVSMKMKCWLKANPDYFEEYFIEQDECVYDLFVSPDDFEMSGQGQWVQFRMGSSTTTPVIQDYSYDWIENMHLKTENRGIMGTEYREMMYMAPNNTNLDRDATIRVRTEASSSIYKNIFLAQKATDQTLDVRFVECQFGGGEIEPYYEKRDNTNIMRMTAGGGQYSTIMLDFGYTKGADVGDTHLELIDLGWGTDWMIYQHFYDAASHQIFIGSTYMDGYRLEFSENDTESGGQRFMLIRVISDNGYYDEILVRQNQPEE